MNIELTFAIKSDYMGSKNGKKGSIHLFCLFVRSFRSHNRRMHKDCIKKRSNQHTFTFTFDLTLPLVILFFSVFFVGVVDTSPVHLATPSTILLTFISKANKITFLRKEKSFFFSKHQICFQSNRASQQTQQHVSVYLIQWTIYLLLLLVLNVGGDVFFFSPPVNSCLKNFETYVSKLRCNWVCCRHLCR